MQFPICFLFTHEKCTRGVVEKGKRRTTNRPQNERDMNRNFFFEELALSIFEENKRCSYDNSLQIIRSILSKKVDYTKSVQ